MGIELTSETPYMLNKLLTLDNSPHSIFIINNLLLNLKSLLLKNKFSYILISFINKNPCEIIIRVTPGSENRFIAIRN